MTAADAHPGATVVALWWTATLRRVGRPRGAACGDAAERAARAQLRRGPGFGWFVMLPLCVGGVRRRRRASSRAWCGRGAGGSRRWRSPSAIVVASVAWGVWRFYAAPPIFGYDPFVGYFAGTLYDEDVAVTARVRVGAPVSRDGAGGGADLVRAASSTAPRLALRAGADGARRRARARARAALVAARAVAGARAARLRADGRRHRDAPRRRAAHGALRPALLADGAVRQGHRRLRRGHRAALAGARGASSAGRRRRRCTRSSSTTSADKRALMGAAHTFIAKPWRREIYLQYDALAAGCDLARARRTCSPGRTAIRSSGSRGAACRFNVGLIEGVAVAASWAGNPLTPHQIVKVLRDAGLVDAGTLGVGDGAELLRDQRRAGVQRRRLVLPLSVRHARRRQAGAAVSRGGGRAAAGARSTA